MAVNPLIGPEIFAMRSDFTALSIHAEFVRNGPSDAYSVDLLRTACSELDAAPWAEDHLNSWRDAYRAFGAKPQRTPCSAEALRKRAQRDHALPAVNAVVDLYNALSVRYALPIGGEDAVLYDGAPTLVQASGDELFDTISEGEAKIEKVDRGEVIWRDAQGVTCRRWNWRQGTRTRISESSTSMWFVLERLDPMPVQSLLEAGAKLIDGLRRLSPEIHATQRFLDQDTYVNQRQTR
ncbi:phenylalanine--tRNA ligase beta subunit-related protein [Boseaceae bacterium BT-24-1]|nr:phenylalanine--tRNA ligase beta subunit-related protein [Boseaceae bacterium BT-24-1]